jgi:prepilin-type N-terminal cleavage/methylation domain-containing protein
MSASSTGRDAGRRGGSRPPRDPARGFTMIELLVALAIVAVLTGLSFAALHQLSPRARLRNAVMRLTAAMANGRSLADDRDVRVALLFNSTY